MSRECMFEYTRGPKYGETCHKKAKRYDNYCGKCHHGLYGDNEVFHGGFENGFCPLDALAHEPYCDICYKWLKRGLYEVVELYAKENGIDSDIFMDMIAQYQDNKDDEPEPGPKPKQEDIVLEVVQYKDGMFREVTHNLVLKQSDESYVAIAKLRGNEEIPLDCDDITFAREHGLVVQK